MQENIPRGVKMRIDFIRSGQVITYYPVVIRAEGDLFRAMKNAFERLRKEHPTLGTEDVEVSVKYDN
jgi:hypothetical protein